MSPAGHSLLAEPALPRAHNDGMQLTSGGLSALRALLH
jgi:hypothetical protein